PEAIGNAERTAAHARNSWVHGPAHNLKAWGGRRKACSAAGQVPRLAASHTNTAAMQATRVFHRHLHQEMPFAVSGQGITLTDSQGKTYLDASGGAAVSCLGHGHPDVIAAMHAQIDQLAYAHTSFFTTAVAEELADTLIESAPAGMSNVYFVSGGSEAVEAALKMARQYFVEIGQPQRRYFIARRQ